MKNGIVLRISSEDSSSILFACFFSVCICAGYLRVYKNKCMFFGMLIVCLTLGSVQSLIREVNS